MVREFGVGNCLRWNTLQFGLKKGNPAVMQRGFHVLEMYIMLV